MSVLKRFWPLLLMSIGFLLILGGNFYYAMIEEGSSDLNPTREHISDLISMSGSVMLVAGAIAGVIRFFIRQFRPKTNL